ncbi:L,D-transpeptidase family protein [Sphingomonas sp. CFBP 13728]|uniref:L,D-transpeptidase family protein n=1 Tax=Sphingomonas sp. CFBP 13728 TaxID=2775294 RepID=UPI0031593E79
MRIVSIGASLLAMTAALSGCEVKTTTAANQQVPAAAAKPAGWTKTTAEQLRKAIAARGAHGLDRMSFDASAQPGADDAALTKAAIAYGTALAQGATDPAKLFDVYTVPRSKVDVAQGLAAALQAGDIGKWLSSLAPQDDNYARLSKAYLALPKQEQPASEVIPDNGEAIKPGQADPRVPAIAQQLVAFDYLDRAAAQGDRLTPAMILAIKKMQADYGIKPDGMIGTAALGILNLSDADRARAIAVNMERLRWLDRNAPGTRIDVNLAAARLSYWRDGKLVDSRKVVVGEPDKETPQLGSPIFRLVANPTWTVPRSVEKKEMAGKGAAYLRANNLAWKDGWLVQQSGPKNSLGLVKFDMTNDHAIYLHDTPAKQLFAEIQRQRSHGCVRVEDALGFAEMLAKDQGVTDQWHQARATGKETFVKLPKEIPVRLLYQTVLFDDAGEPVIRADPYGWNDRVAVALGLGSSATYKPTARDADVGP